MSTPSPTSAAAALGTVGNGVEHLPYGSFTAGDAAPRLGVRLGDHVLDVAAVLDLAGGNVSAAAREAADSPSLDGLLACSKAVWDEVRGALQAAFLDPARTDAILATAVPLSDVTLGLPFTVADYVDFYGNEFHARNVGKIFRPHMEPLTANWKHLPIGYHGRAGTIVPSGTDFPRPQGMRPEPEGPPSFGPSRRLDIEAEVGFVLGSPVPQGRVPLHEAEQHVFGLTLANDWSARDIQSFEYVPLGPNLGKSFCTTISPWVTPLAALAGSRVAPPPRDTPLASYLDDSDADPWCFDLQIEISLNGEVISVAPFAETYWTAAQMLAHMTVNGAGLRAGDFFAGGTVSGPERNQRGSFLEICWGGSEPLTLKDGSEFTFLRDGDEVSMRATAPGPDGSVIALGECTGRVLPPANS
ncbi:fumarylacetoacetate hydrolase family protein [Streptomyces sp. NBC_01635]|uniref:fumarylacetoacetase n=1 Tax=Streptomyces hirsutus TaxID=35620 RepID=A0ABZ1GY61_9ACTN|nr:fumarylacetoacetate hydrolase family protein [Streptomyces hirsutus]WSD09728.1 fumarylacetoacetate hydrolase family protein [Streptomyces hirsutus]WTD78186.1 fumarylacetoacetate hydrolase family protein [Streptomyces sp. NBC_01635]